MGFDTPSRTHRGPWTFIIKTPWALIHLQKHLVGLGISVKTHHGPWNLGIETPWAIDTPTTTHHGPWTFIIKTQWALINLKKYLVGLGISVKPHRGPWNFSKNPPWALELGY